MRLAPRRFAVRGSRRPQPEFYRLLAEAGQNLQLAAELMYDLLATWPDDHGVSEQISRCEEEGDRITHKIVERLHRSRIAPFDRDDIYALAGAIDDVVDDIEEGAQELAVYRIEAPMEQAQQLAGVLRDCGRALARALDGLESFDVEDADFAHIRRLEQEGDRISSCRESSSSTDRGHRPVAAEPLRGGRDAGGDQPRVAR